MKLARLSLVAWGALVASASPLLQEVREQRAADLAEPVRLAGAGGAPIDLGEQLHLHDW